jgi:hypothetical protein
LAVKLHHEPTPVPLFVLDIDYNIQCQFALLKAESMPNNMRIKVTIKPVINYKRSNRGLSNSGPSLTISPLQAPELVNFI